MRLTLRTLLAYLDNILEPNSMQAMSQKLDESPAAAELVHRIRDVTKKVRLAAPSVEGKGIGLDPNTVAEYLDNTLPGERTPDFEMVCLESDVHLAEVAACHEILSLVLVKPAEIDPASRQKMYDVINQKAPAAAKPASVTPEATPIATPVAAAVATPVAHEQARKREVPDYLRESQPIPAVQARRGWQIAVVAALILLLVGGTAVLALAPVESVPRFLQPIAKMLHPQAQVAQSDDDSDDRQAPTVVPQATAGDTADTSTSVATPTPLRQPDSVVATAADTSTTPVPASPVGTAAAIPDATTTTVGELRQPASAVVGVPADTATVVSPAAPVPPVPTEVLPPDGRTGTNPPPASVTSSTVLGTNVAGTPPAATIPAAPPKVTTPSTTTPDAAPPTTPTTPAKVEPVGRVSSPISQVLLRFDPAQSAWVRMPAREQLMVGDRLLTLPDYRSQVSFANSLTVDMLGGTLVELTPIDASGTPGILLLRGRLLLYTVGGNKASLRLDNTQPATTFNLSTAELGVEFVPQRAPGADPSVANPWLVRLFATNGDITWSVPGGAEAGLTVPGTAVLTATAPPAAEPAVGEMPRWLTHDDRDLLQKQAADAIEARLRGDKAVSVVLREILSDRPPRMENVQLALRCLAQIGEYSDFMPLLRDPTQRYSTWDRYVAMLVEAVDYGPVYANAIRNVFVTQHGDQGDLLYRMLWSYTNEQLNSGAALFLVESLDHEELDFRVIAYWTLCDITGLNLSYLPQDPDLKRRPNVQKWEAKREAGQIVRKTAS